MRDHLFYVHYLLSCLFFIIEAMTAKYRSRANKRSKTSTIKCVLFHTAPDVTTCTASCLYHWEAPPRLRGLITGFYTAAVSVKSRGSSCGIYEQTGEVSLPAPQFSPSFITIQVFHIHLSPGDGTMSPSASAVSLN
jgi:hypothetical protein